MTANDSKSYLSYLNKLVAQYKNTYHHYFFFQKKRNSLIIKDYNFFLRRVYFTSNDESENTFVYQPTLDILELKKDRSTNYVLSWKSKGVFNSNLKPFYTAFLEL